MLLITVLALLVAFGSSQEAGFDVQTSEGASAGFEMQMSSSVNEEQQQAEETFPEVGPTVVPRNEMGLVARAVASSSLPVWSIVVLSFSCIVFAAAVCALLFTLLSSKMEDKKKAGLIVSVSALVLAVIGISVALGVGMGQLTSTGLVAGQRIEMASAVPRVISSGTGSIWQLIELDMNGEETATQYLVQDAGRAIETKTRASADGGTLPPPNEAISCTVRVTSDGKVVFETWTIKASAQGRAASNKRVGSKRIAAYRVRYAAGVCDAANTLCEPICTGDVIRSLFLGGPQSIQNFYRSVSNGRLSLDFVDVYDAVVDTRVSTFNTISRIQKQRADYHIMFFPPNSKHDAFSGNAGGFGRVDSDQSWIKTCSWTVVAHELGHNFGFHHAGSRDASGARVEYGDATSVMSSAYLTNQMQSQPNLPVGPGWIGIGANQIFLNGWLPVQAVLEITRNGAYEIPNSLSSNTGVRCARIKTGSSFVWVEFREPRNQDIDLPFTNLWFSNMRYRNVQGTVLNSLLVKTIDRDSRSMLEGFLAPGQSVLVNGVTITRAPVGRIGQFTVSGLRR